jgi:CheY-like chemotaxis protein
MPGMNGADLAAHLRASHPKVVILFMSGYAGDLAVRAGISDTEELMIHKPFTKKDLLIKIRTILDESAHK